MLSALLLLLVSITYFPAILTQHIKITSISAYSLRRGKKQQKMVWKQPLQKITCESFSFEICIFYHTIFFFYYYFFFITYYYSRCQTNKHTWDLHLLNQWQRPGFHPRLQGFLNGNIKIKECTFSFYFF